MSPDRWVYIIEGDAITPVARKTFDEFFFREGPALRAYSGRTLTFALPAHEPENGRAGRVVRFDTLRLAVNEDGSLDEDHYRLRLADIFAAIDAQDQAEAAMARQRRSPQISEEAFRRIRAHLKIQQPVVGAAVAENFDQDAIFDCPQCAAQVIAEEMSHPACPDCGHHPLTGGKIVAE
jgi:DNA-directed RNA polymerase subunit RPC12/RpoP